MNTFYKLLGFFILSISFSASTDIKKEKDIDNQLDYFITNPIGQQSDQYVGYRGHFEKDDLSKKEKNLIESLLKSSETQKTPTILNSKPSISRIHTCPQCGKEFSRPFNLKRHLRTHKALNF